MGTLDASLPESQKAIRTEQLAKQWERHSPLPVQDQSEPQVNESRSDAKDATEGPRMQEYVAVSCAVHTLGSCLQKGLHLCNAYVHLYM